MYVSKYANCVPLDFLPALGNVEIPTVLDSLCWEISGKFDKFVPDLFIIFRNVFIFHIKKAMNFLSLQKIAA